MLLTTRRDGKWRLEMYVYGGQWHFFSCFLSRTQRLRIRASSRAMRNCAGNGVPRQSQLSTPARWASTRTGRTRRWSSTETSSSRGTLFNRRTSGSNNTYKKWVSNHVSAKRKTHFKFFFLWGEGKIRFNFWYIYINQGWPQRGSRAACGSWVNFVRL